MLANRRHYFAHRPLGAECLERRNPLAGDVAVALFGNQLILQGDAQANSVVISRAASGGLDISGSGQGNAATTINGSTQPFHVGSATNMFFNLGDGNDSVTIGNGVQGGSEGSSCSSGDISSSSAVSGAASGLTPLRLSGNLFVDLGAGDDSFNANLNSHGNVTVMGGSGSDQVAVSGRIGSLVVLADPLSTGTSGADVVRLSDLRTNGDVNVSTMAGNDQLSLAGNIRVHGNLNIDSGDGTDAFSMATSRFNVSGQVNIDQSNMALTGSDAHTSTSDTSTASNNGANTSAELTSNAAANSAASATRTAMDGPAMNSTGTSSNVAGANLSSTGLLTPDSAASSAMNVATTTSPTMIDPVGAGNTGLLLNNSFTAANDATAGNVAADSTVANDATSGIGGVAATNSFNTASSDISGLTNNPALNDMAAGTPLANSPVTTAVGNPVTGTAGFVDPAQQSALLQNAPNLAAASQNSQPNIAATDNVFNQIGEADLVGSAAGIRRF